MAVGIAKCSGCAKEFKWKRSTGIPAKWCSRLCQKIRIDRTGICETCGKEYIWKEGKDKNSSRFCSRKCLYMRTGLWVTESKTFWKNATEEEKLERTKKLFEEGVIRKEGCWDWSKAIHHSGYAPMCVNGKQINAHIVSWMIHKGKIPKGKLVCHTCDNPRCTNPDHLFIGSHKDNIQDCVTKGRNSRGENHYYSLLSDLEVKEIKKLLDLGVSCARLAKDYGVSSGCIWFIKNGSSWKYVK